MTKPKFIIRLDDICPRMDWEKFEAVQKLLDEHEIKPLIGVVPNNRDTELMIDKANPNFWQLMRDFQLDGWTIAQHGFEHLYHTRSGGMFKRSNQGEFAGLPYDYQVEMLQEGKELLNQEGLYTNTFMAPSHSLDKNTLEALKTTGFQYITDGYALYPYKWKGLTFVPQLFATPLHFGFGIYTICLHTNALSLKEFNNFKKFIQKNADRCISFKEGAKYASNNFLNTAVANHLFRSFRTAKDLISKAV